MLCLVLFFRLWATPGKVQGLLLAMCCEIVPGLGDHVTRMGDRTSVYPRLPFVSPLWPLFYIN